MLCKTFLSLVPAIVTAIASVTALANNNLFLPGDAFFPTSLTKSDIEALLTAKAGERAFKYSSFGGYEAAFCGYAGYDQAQIPAVDDAFARNLAIAYGRLRELSPRELTETTRDGKEELVETNGMRVLFYAADYTFPGRPLGLRYNENWIAEAVRFGHHKDHVRLCCLIPDPQAVEWEWRDADVVPPLKATLPDMPLKPIPEITEAPVKIQGPVKAIVIGNYTLKELFDCEKFPFPVAFVPTVYVVDSNGLTELTCMDGTWNSSDAEDADDEGDPEDTKRGGGGMGMGGGAF